MPFSWPWASYGSADVVRRLTLVAAPTGVPLTVADAKTHLRVEHNNEDDLLEALVAAAQGHVERVTNRQLVTATWKLKLDRFPCGPIEIPVAPLLTVVSVKYRDADDVLQTWATSEYVVDAPSGPHATTGRVYLALNKTYPALADRPDAVEVEFTAGYGPNAESVPQALRQAMLLLIGHWYENRESVITGTIAEELPFAVEALLESFTRPLALIR